MIYIIIFSAYFSINTWIACSTWLDNKIQYLIYFLFGLPIVVSQLIWHIVLHKYCKLSNKYGITFYFRHYLTNKYKNMSEDDIARIKRTSENHKNPNVRKWAKIIINNNK